MGCVRLACGLGVERIAQIAMAALFLAIFAAAGSPFLLAAALLCVLFFVAHERLEGLLQRVFLNQKIALLLLLFGCLYAAVVFSVKYFPNTDGPNHLLMAHIARSLLDGGQEYAQYFELHLSLAPNALADIAVVALSYLFGLALAEKIIISAYFLLFPLSVLYFLESVSPKKAWAAVFIVPLMPNILVGYGFFNFLLGVCFAFFLSGWFLRQERNGSVGGKLLLLLNALSVTLYFAHLVGFLAYVSIIAVFLLERGGARKIPLVVKANAIAIVFALLFVAGRATDANAQPAADLFKGAGIAPAILYAAYFPTYLSFEPYFVVFFLCLCIYFLGALANGIFKAGACLLKGEGTQFAAPFLLCALLLVFVLMPDNIFGWDVAKPRLLPVIFGLAPLLASPAFPKNERVAVILVFVLAGAARVVWMHDAAAQGSQYVEGVATGAAGIAENSTLAAFSRSTGEFIPHLWHTWAYYCIEKSCISPNIFARYSSFFPVKYRQGELEALGNLKENDDSEIFRLDDAVFTDYGRYDYLLFSIRANDTAWVRGMAAPGFVEIFSYSNKNDTWLLFENEKHVKR